MKARVIRKTAIFLGTLALLTIALILSLSLALSTNSARDLILRHASETIPGDLHIRHLSLSLLTGSIDIRGFALDDAHGKALVRVERFTASVSLLSLLTATLNIRDCRIQAPLVYLSMDREGRLNLAEAFGTNDERVDTENGDPFSLPLNVKLGNLDLGNGLLVYRQDGLGQVESRNVGIHARDVNVFRGSGRFSLESGPCDLQSDGRKIDLETFSFSGRLEKDRLTSLALYLASGDLTLDARGDVNDLFTRPWPDLTVSLTLPLENISKDLALPISMKGQLFANATVHGDLNDPNVSLRISGKDLSVKRDKVRDLDLFVRLSRKRLTLGHLNLDADKGTVRATGRMELAQAFPDGFLSGRRRFGRAEFSVNLETDIPQLEVLPYLDGTARGDLGLAVDVNGKGLLPHQMAVQADISARSTKLSLWDAPASPYRLAGQAVYDSGRLRVVESELTCNDNTLSLSGNYDIQTGAWQGDSLIPLRLAIIYAKS